MELYIDLEKGRLNTAKLVKRPVQVRGKNGKIYTRMQWVDPKTGMPVSDSHGIGEVHQEHPHMTQKEHIDAHIKKMSREEKYHHIEKHGIEWKRNNHPAIDHKNAVEALKQHFYKNPHLAGAEHLPKEADPNRTPDDTDRINDFTNKYKKHPELLYDMLRHVGIIDKEEPDPRTVEGQQPKNEGGNGMGAIKHMRNLMAFKKHLKENPHLIEEMMNHPEFGKPHGTNTSGSIKAPEKPEKQEKPKSKAQQGGNTIKGILDSMSSEEKYKLCKQLGIAEQDPRQDPSIDPKMAPIHHMRNMMQLKKEIEKNPSLLNIDPDTGGLSEQEKQRINSLDENEKKKHDADEFLKRASRDLKLKWAKDFADHEHMKNRKTNDHEHIDNMHKISALKKILIEDPSVMKKLEPELEKEELMNLKIGNKMMGKILRQVVGLKGIGDVVAGYDKGKEWEFGVASTAMIQEDDEGEPILSIVDAGKDGEEYNEYVIPMKKVKEFMDNQKSGNTDIQIKPKEIPLHKKSAPDIWKALNEDFEGNYNEDVGNALKIDVSKLYDAAGRKNMISRLASSSDSYIDTKTLVKLFEKYGVKMQTSAVGTLFDSRSDEFKRVVFGHKVEKTKTKDAMEYLEKDSNGEYTDTWVLHESAKHWTPDQRAEARKDFIRGNISVEVDNEMQNADDRKVKLISHIHKSLEHVPFDLLTDVFASGKVKMNFHKKGYDGKHHMGNFYNGVLGGIWFDHAYARDDSLLESEHPLHFRPSNSPYPDNPNRQYVHHPFSDTVAHEFAHAIDCYLSGGGNNYLKWDKTVQGQKYAGKHANAVMSSYDNSIKRSNSKNLMAMVGSGSQSYYIHLDEFMSSYEGRIYDPRYYTASAVGTLIEKEGRFLKDISETGAESRGIEHWSENVARTFNALHAFQQWKEDTGDKSTDFDSWAERMHKEFMDKGYGDDTNHHKMHEGKLLNSYRHNATEGRIKYPAQAYGYMYHAMKKRHPELHEGIKNVLLRPDFLGDSSVADPVSRANVGDFARKSEKLDLIIKL